MRAKEALIIAVNSRKRCKIYIEKLYIASIEQIAYSQIHMKILPESVRSQQRM